MRRLIAVVALPMALSMTLAAPATAARPTSATLTVSTADASAASSTPTVGSSLVFSGCGYTPGDDVLVQVTSPTAVTTFGVMPDAAGCISTEENGLFPVRNAGEHKAAAYQSNRRKADATVTFTVSS
jgi:hypothetical protein